MKHLPVAKRSNNFVMIGALFRIGNDNPPTLRPLDNDSRLGRNSSYLRGALAFR